MKTALRPTFLPFSRPTIGEEEINEVVDSLRSGWITTGPKVDRFARLFAEYVGGRSTEASGSSRFAAPVSSATAGLHLALLSHGVGPGDEVITTPLTFAATLNVIELVGARPVLADIDRHTLLIRVPEMERRITSRTRALLPVHFAGQPADLDPILDLARSRGLAVIEDAAHAAGTEYKGSKIGSFATTSVFSFHPNKNMTTGEGGMVMTPDKEVFRKVSRMLFHGIDRSAFKAGSARYDIALPGYKYNMMDLQAALGLHQMPRLDGFIEERRRRAEIYQEAFRDQPGLILPKGVPYAARHAWHLYTPLVDIDCLRIDRDDFMSQLRKRNIGSGLHYLAAHEFSYYSRTYGWRPTDFPEAHFVSQRILSLPLFPSMSDQDQNDVIEAVRDICRSFVR